MKIICPKCEQETELKEVNGLIQCEHCGEWFGRQRPMAAAAPAPDSARVEKIHRVAIYFSRASDYLVFGAIFALFFMVFAFFMEKASSGAGDTDVHIYSAFFWMATKWCVYWSLILFSIGQLVHIRANTEK